MHAYVGNLPRPDVGNGKWEMGCLCRDGEVPSQKELSSYFEELFSSKVPHQKELSSPNEELFPNPGLHLLAE